MACVVIECCNPLVEAAGVGRVPEPELLVVEVVAELVGEGAQAGTSALPSEAAIRLELVKTAANDPKRSLEF